MKLRLAMVGACPYPVPQGSQVFLRETALALRARGHEVRLVVYGHGLYPDDTGLPIHRTRRWPGDTTTRSGPNWAKPVLDLNLWWTLRAVCRRHRIDVVHAHNYEGLLVALGSGRPVVYHPHNAMSDELPYYFEGPRRRAMAEWFGRWLDRRVPRRAQRVVAPHRRLAGHLIIRGCAHNRVRVVPPPLEVERFTPAAAGGGRPHVLYAGNLDAYQNLDLLFAAMARVRIEAPDTRLRIATADPIDVVGADVVSVRDFPAVRAELAQDAVFAVPRVSWSGYPIKLLNAMAAGLPVVACESAAYPLTHRESGLVVPDNDAQAFADALRELLNDPRLRAELGRNARAKVARENNPERIAEAIERIDLELLGRAPATPAVPTESPTLETQEEERAPVQ